jgi:hypothetical protein
MLDDLRKSTGEVDFDEPGETTFATVEDSSAGERKFLGMTAVERMFLVIFIFLNVVVLGTALLLFTGRLVL